MELLSVCGAIGARALEACARGDASFPLPEGAQAVSLVAESAPSEELRDRARAWLDSDASYHALVRLCADAVVAFDALHAPAASMYGPKASAELEPMLALWPAVIALPVRDGLSDRDMIELRAFPVHPLAVTGREAHADGGRRSPSEFFFHDLDHARFKVREDLREMGIEIPDAYRDGTTVDAGSGAHRVILPFARGKIGDALWQRAGMRRAFGRDLFARLDRLDDRLLARACELMLFEIVHEKSFPLEPRALARELASEAHVEKLLHKHRTRFFADGDPGHAVFESLGAARKWLGDACA